MEEGGGLIGQLGINWKLLLSQAVNFFILLLVLRAFVYKPLLQIIKKRNERIQEGLEKAKEADIRLREVDSTAKDKIKGAELESVSIIKNTERKAKQLEQSLSKEAEEYQKNVMENIKMNEKLLMEESRQNILRDAAELVKKVIVKTVELKPEAIDEALIKKATAKVNEQI